MPYRFSMSITLNRLRIQMLVLISIGFQSIGHSQSTPSDQSVSGILYCLDDTNTLIARDVLTQNDSLWKESGDVDLNLGFYRGTAWLIATLRSADPSGLTYLEIKNPLLNQAEFYELTDAGPKILNLSGDNQEFASRAFDHRHFILPVKIQSNESKTILIKTSTHGEQFLIPLRKWSREQLEARDDRDLLVRGSYYGLVIFVLLFNLFIYLMIREASSFYYLLYNLALLILQLSLSGHAFQYLWPNSSWLANVTNPFMASVSIFALMRFSQTFLKLQHYYPGFNRFFHYTGYLLLVNAGMALLFSRPSFDLSILIVNGVALVLNLLIIPIAWKVYREKFRPAKFFLLAFIVLVLTVFGFILTNFGIIKNEFLSDYGLLMGSALEVILLSFAIVDRFKAFKDEAFLRLQEINRIQADSNEQLEMKVTERTEEVVRQKQEIESKNEEIVSSIRYAQRIQESLLPSTEQLKSVFDESFVLFIPKDIVSGDFFWVNSVDTDGVGRKVFALGDCTGHGVPGAFMGVLGYNFLDQMTDTFRDNSPGYVMDQLHQHVVNALQNDAGPDVLRDGMDIVIGVIDPEKMTLTYSSANQKLILLRGNQLFELEGDHQAIGQLTGHAFSSHTFQLEEGDLLYAFTDGYKDQFGGDNGKKLKITGFRTLLHEVSHLELSRQKEHLLHAFMQWKGELEQVDDVCVLGVRV